MHTTVVLTVNWFVQNRMFHLGATQTERELFDRLLRTIKWEPAVGKQLTLIGGYYQFTFVLVAFLAVIFS